MKKIYTLLSLFFVSANVFAQFAISYVPVATYNKTQIDSIYTANGIPAFILPISYEVTVYKVLYNTVSFDSSATFASGALILPNGPTCKMSLVSYQHGTILAKEEAPSRNTGEVIIGIALATDGYAVSMPDYLGLGDSPIPVHPYVHAHSEATASVDMLRASKEIIQDSLGYQLNDQLFLIGYSQGGHATLALQKLIEEQLTSEFTITFSDPMSGPYDLSNTQAEVITNDSMYSQPAFLPFVIFSYNEVYNLFSIDSAIFVHPYDTLLPPLFDGTHDIGDVNAIMPAIPNEILQPMLLDSFRNDTNQYFRVALRDNDLINWAPSSPTKLYYCEADEQVYYQNALVALNSFIQNGSTSVTAQSAGATLGHVDCAHVALILGKFDFDAVRNDKITTTLSSINESSAGANNGSIQMTVTGGIQPYMFQWSNSATTQNLSNLSSGWYYVTITDNNQCSKYDSIYVGLTTDIAEWEHAENKIKLFPNPASSFVNIVFENLIFKEGILSVYDVTGTLMRNVNLSASQKIIFEKGNLSPGVYFLKFTFDIEHNAYKKLVIQNTD